MAVAGYIKAFVWHIKTNSNKLSNSPLRTADVWHAKHLRYEKVGWKLLTHDGPDPIRRI
jgi:hypothetical protein